MLGKAIAITAEAFKHKYDKGGNPYILHCLFVMNEVAKVHPKDMDLLCAAIMHDLIEDCKEWTYERLIGEGFSDDVIFILKLITHDKKEDYDQYIRRIGSSQEATAIKLADLRHNSDITRMKGLRKKDFERLEKYHRDTKSSAILIFDPTKLMRMYMIYHPDVARFKQGDFEKLVTKHFSSMVDNYLNPML